MRTPHRHSWLRTQPAFQGVKRRVTKSFRSDNDLHQLRMWGQFALPTTLFCFALLEEWGVAFDYTPLAAAPASLLYILLSYRSWRDRKAGRRFSDYSDGDLSA